MPSAGFGKYFANTGKENNAFFIFVLGKSQGKK